MKKLFLITLLVILVGGILLGGCAAETTPAPAPTTPTPTAPAPAEKVYEFKMSDYQPAELAQAKWLEAWADKINKDSNGRIEIRIFHGAVLLPSNNTWPGVAEGVAELGCSFRYETFGKDFHEYISQFLIGAPSSREAQQIYYDCYDKFPELQKEWSANKVIVLACPPEMNMHNNSRPVHTPADLKGLQIRVMSSAYADEVEAWGGTPVFAPINEAYEMLQKNTVQGILCGVDVLKLFRVGEVCKYTTYIKAGYSPDFFLAMNWDSYNSLPADLQKVIDDSIPWARKTIQDVMVEQGELAIDFVEGLNKGYEFYTPTSAELKQWHEPIYPLLKDFAASVDAKGLPGTELYNFVRDEVQKYSSK